MNNMYSYVAACNPNMAKAICHKYGYQIVNVKTPKDLGVCLEQVVAQEGETALKDIVRNHPDKEIIMEVCASENFVGADGTQSREEEMKKIRNEAYNSYLNFAGEDIARKQSATSQTNTFLLASAFLMGIAIIATKM